MKIIIQAGGKGTRLKELTQNRPKCIVPVNNLPIIFHMFKKFPQAEFIIIGDYKFEVLEKYLETFSTAKFVLIKAQGDGNICGIKEALNFVNKNEQFMLIWSDLILDENLDIEKFDKSKCYIGLTDKFQCSWSFQNNKLQKTQSHEFGVSGLYIFNNKNKLQNIPQTGSFTKWLADSNINLIPFSIMNSIETGTLEAISKVSSIKNRCRPYNKIEFKDDKVIKTGLTQEGQELINREIVWYKKMTEYGFNSIPKIYSLSPLTMEKINGTNIFGAKLSIENKKKVIDNLIESVNKMHSFEVKNSDKLDLEQEYYTKTIKRIRSIAPSIPFANCEYITINGKKCRNILTDTYTLKKIVEDNLMDTIYCPIHGDCTLTNTMIDNENNIYFIDARGYFGSEKVMGDIRYDWAKLYYSIAGNFDQFNIKNFKLKISDYDVKFEIKSGGWDELTDYFLSRIPNVKIEQLKLIHAIIWISLASHCWEDYDSMCLAFYNGIYLLYECIEGEKNAFKREYFETINA